MFSTRFGWVGGGLISSACLFPETVTYVANIYKYYVAYRLVVDETDRRAAGRAAVQGTERK